MTEPRDYVVFGDEWGLHPTSTQHIVRRLAMRHRVLYVNTVGLRHPSFTVYDVRRAWSKLRVWTTRKRHTQEHTFPGGRLYSPFTIPYNNIGPVRRWNRKRLISSLREQLNRHGFKQPVLLVSSPIGGEVVSALDEALLVYYITDDYAKLPGIDRGYVSELEQALLRDADLVFVTSVELQQKKTGVKAHTVLLRHGVDFDHFHSAVEPRCQPPAGMQSMARPVIGFFGLIAPWVDFDLVGQIARRFPSASIVVIGPSWGGCTPPQLPNLHWLGPIPYAELPKYAAHFDVALVPFRQNTLTAAVNPLKLLEYMALGLPIVANTQADIAQYGNLVYQAGSPEEFVQATGLALENDSPELRLCRIERARRESWDDRVVTLENAVEAALAKKSISGTNTSCRAAMLCSMQTTQVIAP